MSLSTTDSFIDTDRLRAAMFLSADLELMQSKGMKQMHALGVVSKDLGNTVKLLAPIAEAQIYADTLMKAAGDKDKATMLENKETLMKLMSIVNEAVKSVTEIE